MLPFQGGLATASPTTRHPPGLMDRGCDPEVLQRLLFTLGDREAQRGRAIDPRS